MVTITNDDVNNNVDDDADDDTTALLSFSSVRSPQSIILAYLDWKTQFLFMKYLLSKSAITIIIILTDQDHCHV